MSTDLSDVALDLAPTGALRASINLGNPVLAQGTSSEPSGVTVDLAREIASRLGVPVAFVCFDAARKSFEALTTGEADICFLAIEPARAAEVDFTAAYVLIEGVYAVPDDSPIVAVTDVDRPGVRIGVKEGSAYDLYLSRSLEHATLVRGAEGADVFAEQGLEVGAGIRQPLTDFVSSRPGLRVIDEAFMQIRQAVAIRKGHDPATLAWLHATVEELRECGFVADSLARSGRGDTMVAPRD
jgi:polar amino acid transport system substrate-binding protein